MSMERYHARALVAFVALLLSGGFVSEAWAQYFGGNKVRYEDFDYQVLRTEHFDVYYYEEADEAVRMASVLAERWNDRLMRILGAELPDRQPLVLYAGHPHFRQTNATPGEVGETTGGFTELFKRRVVMPFAGPMAETDHVLGHELVHAYQFELAGAEGREGATRRMAAMRLPLWFIEGMAEYLSLGSVDAHTAMWMRDAIVEDDLPSARRIGQPRYFPYRFGHAFWAYVGGRWGDEVVGELLREAGQRGNVPAAIEAVLEIEISELFEGWHEALKEQLGPHVEAALDADEYGTVLLEARTPRGRFNISPSLSPDGSRLVFFSERELGSIELFLFDVEEGEIIRRLTRSATDPHFDSMQFLSSSGSWSPDGERFVYAGVGRGRPVLSIIDGRTGEGIDQLRFDDLVEVFHPAWSPDGRYIAFSANSGGFSDLFVLDLETGERQRLTNDPYAALQPEWTPDGQHLTYVTDRYTSDLDTLTFRGYTIASLDLSTGQSSPLAGLDSGKNINPQWNADGSALYFISDARGTSNVYRYIPETGLTEQLTDVKTGISGIAPLGPALSVAGTADDPRVVVSVFQAGMYNLYRLDDLERHATVVDTAADPDLRAFLPPRERLDPMVDRVLHEPVLEPAQLPVTEAERYRPRLSLDYVAPPTVGVSTGGMGTYIGGGTALNFSDMLGRHNLVTLFELEAEDDAILRNLAAVAGYQNRSQRYTWGVMGGQIPLRSGAFQSFVSNVDGEQAVVTQELRQWQINRELTGGVSYPFNRSQRVEFGAGLRHIDFKADVRTRAFSLETGRLILDDRTDLAVPDALTMATTSAAFVHDTSVFDGTGAMAGQRFRAEIATTSGDLDFWSPTIDYRHYFLPLPKLTLAGRIAHFGRYGGDAEDPRLSRLFLGNPGLVRGYTGRSFRAEDCEPTPEQPFACPAFDQLLGSRIAVANLEARVPLIGGRGLLFETARFPPISVSLFHDAGVAWDRRESPSMFGGERSLVRSYGASLRLNLAGMLGLQWSYVNPQDRTRDWHWEFTLSQAF